MIQLGYVKHPPARDERHPTTQLYLFTDQDKARLQEIVKTLNECGITMVWLSTAAFFEGAWAVTFPHHGDQAKDPVEELKKAVGPF